MNDEANHEFIAPVLKSETGYLKQHYVPVPAEIAEELLVVSRRVIMYAKGQSIRRALQNTKDGTYFIALGVPLLKKLDVVLGDELVLALTSDPNPDYIDLGVEFTEVLEMDEEAADRFFSFTPGRQRGLALHVNSAKKEETRIKRALDIAHKLKTYTLSGDQKDKQK